jgi:hypothetical protein
MCKQQQRDLKPTWQGIQAHVYGGARTSGAFAVKERTKRILGGIAVSLWHAPTSHNWIWKKKLDKTRMSRVHWQNLGRKFDG